VYGEDMTRTLAIVAPLAPHATTPTVEIKVAAPTVAEQLTVQYGCSNAGLPKGVIPAGALVAEANGNTTHTTFDKGWAVYLDHASTRTMLAVCER
jgi:hypothetical protein